MQPAQHPVCRVVAAAFLIALWFTSQVAAQTGDDYDDPFVDYATGLEMSLEFADGTRLVRRAPRPFSTAAMPAGSGELRSVA
ncbi:MAG: hypothetical protein KDA41_11620, partial [Planctomycetales bacterium]|nr:hypothetical protein [Planctomycetales bacterium]